MLAHSTRVAKELGIAATNACAAAKSVCGHDRVWLVVRPRDRFVLVGAMGPVADIAARLFAAAPASVRLGTLLHWPEDRPANQTALHLIGDGTAVAAHGS